MSTRRRAPLVPAGLLARTAHPEPVRDTPPDTAREDQEPVTAVSSGGPAASRPGEGSRADERPAPDFVPPELLPEQRRTLAAEIRDVFDAVDEELLSLPEIVHTLVHDVKFGFAAAFPATDMAGVVNGEDGPTRVTRRWLGKLVERGDLIEAGTYAGLEYWQSAAGPDKPGDTTGTPATSGASATGDDTGARNPGQEVAAAFARQRAERQRRLDELAAPGRERAQRRREAQEAGQLPPDYPDWQIVCVFVVLAAIVLALILG